MRPVDGAVIQLHRTLHCNLSCTHCYSDSGPRQRQALSMELVGRALADARAEGYGLVSLSGGEPLMDPCLDDLIDCARATGMRVNLVTKLSPPAADILSVSEEPAPTGFRDQASWLRRLTRRLAGPSADDLAQETWARKLARDGTVEERNPRAYLATIARNLVTDHARRSHARGEAAVAFDDLPEYLAPSFAPD